VTSPLDVSRLHHVTSSPTNQPTANAKEPRRPPSDGACTFHERQLTVVSRYGLFTPSCGVWLGGGGSEAKGWQCWRCSCFCSESYPPSENPRSANVAGDWIQLI